MHCLIAAYYDARAAAALLLVFREALQRVSSLLRCPRTGRLCICTRMHIGRATILCWVMVRAATVGFDTDMAHHSNIHVSCCLFAPAIMHLWLAITSSWVLCLSRCQSADTESHACTTGCMSWPCIPQSQWAADAQDAYTGEQVSGQKLPICRLF